MTRRPSEETLFKLGERSAQLKARSVMAEKLKAKVVNCDDLNGELSVTACRGLVDHFTRLIVRAELRTPAITKLGGRYCSSHTFA